MDPWLEKPWRQRLRLYTGPTPLFHTQQSWYCYCLLSNIQPNSNREKCWVPNTASSLRRPISHSVESWMHWIPSTLRVVLGETSTYGFALPVSSASASTDISDCLIHQSGSPPNIPPDWGIHFIAKEMLTVAYNHGVLWSYQTPHYPEAVNV